MAQTELLQDFLKEAAKTVDSYLQKHTVEPFGPATKLMESMNYSLFAGGKRVRPAIALAAFKACGGTGDTIFYATSALEMFHTFSLIHDDLPCMDDDDFRRGKPTNHKVYGEATAVLAGDALCVLAFQLMAQTGHLECSKTIAKALGTSGMLGGQMGDIMSEGKEVGIEVVDYIHMHKTAALLEASVVIGAQLANAPQKVIDAFTEYGQKIGLAFQVVDDILDLEGTTETLGKDAGSDQDRLKATYPAVLGLPASKEAALKLKEEAIQALEPVEGDMSILRELAEFIVHRVH
jgi:geranylgeranyl diphosphate synthase type II